MLPGFSHLMEIRGRNTWPYPHHLRISSIVIVSHEFRIFIEHIALQNVIKVCYPKKLSPLPKEKVFENIRGFNAA